MENTGNRTKILFIGKADNIYAKIAADFVQQHFHNSQVVFSKRSDPFRNDLLEWEGDLLISYLAQWIIPGELLRKAKMATINLHPGPPAYPGIGCTNFAIYNGEKEFGITCHHMLEKVDTGQIIMVKRFPLFETDTVYSLTQRCYVEILHAFCELMSGLLKGDSFPESHETWTRPPYKRKDLNELCRLTPGMTRQEIDRRIRATTYGEKVWAYMEEGSDIGKEGVSFR